MCIFFIIIGHYWKILYELFVDLNNIPDPFCVITPTFKTFLQPGDINSTAPI